MGTADRQQEEEVRRLAPSDALLPALVATVCIVEVALVPVTGRLLVLALELTACVVLVARRRLPLVAGPVATFLVSAPLGATSEATEDLTGGVLIWAVAIYALGRWSGERAGLAVFGATYVVVALSATGLNPDDVLWGLALFLPPYVLGRLVGRLAAHRALLERERALVEQEAVRAERDRIARELHDVIAHSLSAMVVQTAAGRDLVRRDPERAREVLRRVAETGRRAIAESDRLVRVIGETDGGPGLAPTPGLQDVPALVAELRQQGLTVDLVADPLPVDLPAAVDVSSYRIVREALTNALRYAPDRAVRLEVWRSPAALTIRAVNRADGRTGAGAGLGLVGLRERVDLLHGDLRHGVTDGRFELVATLPTPEEPA